MIWGPVALLLLAGALLVWLGPDERTLGAGIKPVYVHVSLTWTGMAALACAAVVGGVAAIWGRPRLALLGERAAWVGMAFYGAGLGVSILAARVNWGAVFWSEPRMAMSMRVLVVGLLAVAASHTLGDMRWSSLILAAPALLLIGSLAITPRILHPTNPITAGSSAAIQLTFAGLFGLGALAAGWIIWRRKPGGQTHDSLP